MRKDNFVSEILVGVLYFVLGVVFLAATSELIRTFNYVLVCICMIIGVMQLLSFVLNKKYQVGNYTDIFIGAVFIWVSLILYVYYGFIINILPILFSLYLFIVACNMFIRYMEFNKGSGINKNKYLVLFFVALVIGLLLVFNPGSMIYTYLKVTGIYLLVVAFLHFLDCFNDRRRDN